MYLKSIVSPPLKPFPFSLFSPHQIHHLLSKTLISEISVPFPENRRRHIAVRRPKSVEGFSTPDTIALVYLLGVRSRLSPLSSVLEFSTFAAQEAGVSIYTEAFNHFFSQRCVSISEFEDGGSICW